MQTNQLAQIPMSGREYQYGLGWWIEPPPPGRSANEFSDQGGWGTYPWIDTERGYGAFVFLNDDNWAGLELHALTCPIIREQFDKCR